MVWIVGRSFFLHSGPSTTLEVNLAIILTIDELLQWSIFLLIISSLSGGLIPSPLICRCSSCCVDFGVLDSFPCPASSVCLMQQRCSLFRVQQMIFCFDSDFKYQMFKFLCPNQNACRTFCRISMKAP